MKNLNITQVKQYIYLNIKENISVTDIAFVFGVTRQYLHRKFKKETGQSIMGYIISIKLDMAAVDILSGEEDLFNTSEKYSFKTYDIFLKELKKRFEERPEIYDVIEKYTCCRANL